ncbi:hypothetical protein ANN_13960 [Periplaneta americana]|uniref:ZP domain-containing protein n=1 Tax=Periplaneta americana TaxID=6978 RepID=A0ABQ8SW76_PERAM|nr:hypothetical protein ANN_13960 [Periplaneta americana]
MATLLSRDDGTFESCQLRGHEQGLLDELVQPAVTVLSLQYRTVARWVKAFREGRDAVQDNLRTGRSRVEDNTVQLLASLLGADRRWTARELAAEVRVCHKTVLHILQDILGYRKITGLAQALLTTFLDESSLWTKPGLAHRNQPNLKRQSNEWKHPGSSRPKKVRPTQSAVKVMFIVAYDIDGVILHHAVPPRQTPNADYYCRIPSFFMIMQGVTPLALRRWQWEIPEHPPYSHDMNPCDYDLFTKVKEPLRGTRYNTRDELIRAIGRSIRNINKDGRADGVRCLPNIWQKRDILLHSYKFSDEQRRHLASGASRGNAGNSVFGGNVRQGSHGRPSLFHASVRRNRLFQRTICRPALRLRAAVHRQDVFSFRIAYARCGTKPDLHGQFYENTVVVQYDKDLLEVWDEAKRLRCEWFNDYEKTASKPPMVIADLDVIQLDFRGDNVDCWMEIQHGKGPWAPPVSGIVPLGSMLTLVVAINDYRGEFDMRVKSCAASDGGGHVIQLSDDQGCVLRPKMISRFLKARAADERATVITYAFFHAFKFPDALSVHIKCKVEICRHGCLDHCQLGSHHDAHYGPLERKDQPQPSPTSAPPRPAPESPVGPDLLIYDEGEDEDHAAGQFPVVITTAARPPNAQAQTQEHIHARPTHDHERKPVEDSDEREMLRRPFQARTTTELTEELQKFFTIFCFILFLKK